MKTLLSFTLPVLLLQGLSAGVAEEVKLPGVEVYLIRPVEKPVEGPRRMPATVLEVSNGTELTYFVRGVNVESPAYDTEVKRGDRWLMKPRSDGRAGVESFPLKPGAKMLVTVSPEWEERVTRYRFYFYTTEDEKSAKVVSVRSREIERKELGDLTGTTGEEDSRKTEGMEEPVTDEEMNRPEVERRLERVERELATLKEEMARLQEVRPEMVVPEMVMPEEVQPEELKPEELKPEELKPEMIKPEELKPEEMVVPEMAVPEELKPEVIRPETIKQETIKQETIKQETIKQETIKQETIKQEVEEKLRLEDKLQDQLKERERLEEELLELKGMKFDGVGTLEGMEFKRLRVEDLRLEDIELAPLEFFEEPEFWKLELWKLEFEKPEVIKPEEALGK
ncbi:hypothetical protein [Luteolibacter soli]|uniref:Uncharacterized protein n=1 Tax=Luteolibacter soli TaxID=3135280 RepID=A0ABU9AVI6_9BACT